MQNTAAAYAPTVSSLVRPTGNLGSARAILYSAIAITTCGTPASSCRSRSH